MHNGVSAETPSTSSAVGASSPLGQGLTTQPMKCSASTTGLPLDEIPNQSRGDHRPEQRGQCEIRLGERPKSLNSLVNILSTVHTGSDTDNNDTEDLLGYTWITGEAYIRLDRNTSRLRFVEGNYRDIPVVPPSHRDLHFTMTLKAPRRDSTTTWDLLIFAPTKEQALIAMHFLIDLPDDYYTEVALACHGAGSDRYYRHACPMDCVDLFKLLSVDRYYIFHSMYFTPEQSAVLATAPALGMVNCHFVDGGTTYLQATRDRGPVELHISCTVPFQQVQWNMFLSALVHASKPLGRMQSLILSYLPLEQDTLSILCRVNVETVKLIWCSRRPMPPSLVGRPISMEPAEIRSRCIHSPRHFSVLCFTGHELFHTQQEWDNFLEIIGNYPRLQSLEVSHLRFEGDVLLSLAKALRNNTALTRLSVSSFTATIGGWSLLFDALSHHPSLRALTLRNVDYERIPFGGSSPSFSLCRGLDCNMQQTLRLKHIEQMLRTNQILEEIHCDAGGSGSISSNACCCGGGDGGGSCSKGCVFHRRDWEHRINPHLRCNRYRKRLRLLQEVPLRKRVSFLGPALARLAYSPSLTFLLLSMNQDALLYQSGIMESEVDLAQAP